MARPARLPIDSGTQNWDAKIDTNTEVTFDAPLPIHQHVGDETDLESTFPAASYDRCLVWVNHVAHGHWLEMFSDGISWQIIRVEHQYDELTSTSAQTVAHDFVHFTGTGTMDYDLLPAGQWGGRTVFVRNDKASGTLNLDPNGSEEINGGGAGAALVLAVGSTATLFSNDTEIFASIQL